MFARLCDVDVRVIEELCIGDHKNCKRPIRIFVLSARDWRRACLKMLVVDGQNQHAETHKALGL